MEKEAKLREKLDGLGEMLQDWIVCDWVPKAKGVSLSAFKKKTPQGAGLPARLLVLVCSVREGRIHWRAWLTEAAA